MKIAMIGQKGIPATFGGVEKHVEDLSTRLVLAGHDVVVYARSNYTSKKIKNYQGVKIVNLPTVSSKHFDAIVHTFLACIDVVFRRVDVIHFHSIGPSTLIWLVRLFKPRTPVVATFHAQCYHHQKWGSFAKWYLRLGEKMICSMANNTITVSKKLSKYARLKYNGNISYIPNGVEAQDKIKASKIKKWGLEKDNYITVISRLVRHKGVHHVIKAYNQLSLDKKLVIVGDGSFTDGYIKEIKSLAKNNPNIIFTGNQTGETLKELFSNAFLFIHPSESEGLSIALLEAMSYGKVILSSDIPENIEAVKDTGFVFENKNVEDLKNKLYEIVNNKEDISKKGIMAMSRINNYYNWNDIVKNVINIYKDIIVVKHSVGRKMVKKFISFFL